MSPAHVTFAMVKPRLDDEIERTKTALTTCSVAELPILQARHEALTKISLWFQRGAQDTQIFDASV